MTGVTIVTTAGADGQPRGFTANSFTSVSLEPPLLLVCIGKQAASLEVFGQAKGFAPGLEDGGGAVGSVELPSQGGQVVGQERHCGTGSSTAGRRAQPLRKAQPLGARPARDMRDA